MNFLKTKLIISCVLLIATTTALLLEAQEPRDWKNLSETVVLKSGTFEVDLTSKEIQDGVPTKVYVRADSGLKFLQFEKISPEDRSYVCQELGLPVDVDVDSGRLAKGEAAKLYQGARELYFQKKFSLALDKIRLACEKDSENQVYADMKAIIEERIEEGRSSWTGNFEAGTRKTFTINGVEFAFRYCPAGSFTKSRPSDEKGRDDDEPQREVNIDEGFWICETETTQALWDAVGVEKKTGCKFKGANLPVENVSWNESDSFIKKLNSLNIAPVGWRFALPSEEQWEYACRAGTSGSTYGDVPDDAAWYREDSSGTTHAVGTKKPNAWGIYDMLGNVYEWTSSQYEDGSSFIFRGGSWNLFAQLARMANCGYSAPADCTDFLGFRCALVRSYSNWTGNIEAGTRNTLTINGMEFAFRYCPAGSFMMGSPSDEDRHSLEQEPHKVNIGEGFWICETETTQAQWDAVGLKKEKECEHNGTNLPVEMVSWNESDSFIKELNSLNVAPDGWRFALPTEEQWEYACRAGTSGSTYGVPLDEAAWYGFWGDSTHEVGTKRPNNWGVYDMLGNVREWTSSEYEGGGTFMVRGGDYFYSANLCRPAWRYFDGRTDSSCVVGFRAVLVRSK